MAVGLLVASCSTASPPGQESPSDGVTTAVATSPPSLELVPVADAEPTTITSVLGDLEFTAYEVGAGFRPGSLLATAHGFVALSDEGSPRWSVDGVIWWRIPLSLEAEHIAADGEDLILYTGGYPSGAVRVTWDGSAWVEGEQFGIPPGTDSLVYGATGVIAVEGTRYHWSADGTTFLPSDKEPALNSARHNPLAHAHHLATASGFVAMLPVAVPDFSGLPVSVPGSAGWETELWFSSDGSSWERILTENPFGAGAQVDSVAEWGGRYVAVGSTGPIDNPWRGEANEDGGVWLSRDGISWQRVGVAGMGSFWTSVAGGDRGWIVTAYPDQLWFSVDGHSWDGPRTAPEGLRSGSGPAATAVGDDLVVGTGADITFTVGGG